MCINLLVGASPRLRERHRSWHRAAPEQRWPMAEHRVRPDKDLNAGTTNYRYDTQSLESTYVD